MSKKDNLQLWLLSTPKRLVVGMFLLAGAGIVLVLVTLFIVAPQIAAMPNRDPDETGSSQPTEKITSPLLVEVTGSNFRTNSTLRMAPAQSNPSDNPDSPSSQARTNEEPSENPDSRSATLNLDGVEDLKYPESFSNVSEVSARPTPSRALKQTSTPTRSAAANLKKETIESGDPVQFTGMQAFFKDLQTGNFGAMQRSCWLITPEVFTDRYTTPPAQKALLHALSQTPEVTDDGVSWKDSSVELRTSWSELADRYSCPTAIYGGKMDSVTPEDVSYLLARIMARSSYPFNGADTEENYPTLCEKWSPPPGITKYTPEASRKLRYDEEGRLDDDTFKALQDLRSESIHLYAVKNTYPMYIRAAHSQLEEPSAYFYRDKDGSLCLGSVVKSHE
ncbi:hypothetical protein [uncultured Mobiluncus sp.]|uniref:hypothetical protein n=1 Tax=uncultured Mobiluncus sp. TaxID=293425 RepID=UPI002626A4B3|nr:hypothetical protein [uncultured Mobiluncus sp.]